MFLIKLVIVVIFISISVLRVEALHKYSEVNRATGEITIICPPDTIELVLGTVGYFRAADDPPALHYSDHSCILAPFIDQMNKYCINNYVSCTLRPNEIKFNELTCPYDYSDIIFENMWHYCNGPVATTEEMTTTDEQSSGSGDEETTSGSGYEEITTDEITSTTTTTTIATLSRVLNKWNIKICSSENMLLKDDVYLKFLDKMNRKYMFHVNSENKSLYSASYSGNCNEIVAEAAFEELKTMTIHVEFAGFFIPWKLDSVQLFNPSKDITIEWKCQLVTGCWLLDSTSKFDLKF